MTSSHTYQPGPAGAPSVGRLPTLFIPHGGGPWPFLKPTPGQPAPWGTLETCLRGLDQAIGARPRAVLVISGHWEERLPTVSTHPHPGLLYDYYGFPEHTYQLSYPAPGSPELAARTRALLAHAGIDSAENASRGFDHGTFIPFMLIYPQADVPLVQLSLRADLDPTFHMELGQALAPLREEGVLIVGSGLSFHNLQRFWRPDEATRAAAQQFDDWLAATVEEPDPDMRARHLRAWESAPFARLCHPRSEHLVPLFVATGAAETDRGRRTYADTVFGLAHSGFQFG
ncbi:DODA-type extradiol aromatic ring-opening family dioxygenase [Xanthobacter sp. TB0139]|uniref:DODA-type extradiol aromatic ring-opening family dioxygenase n=1 Tax=Xanthobacter sp. TB0139 TaxID=3459178 RepID=UPI004039393B